MLQNTIEFYGPLWIVNYNPNVIQYEFCKSTKPADQNGN